MVTKKFYAQKDYLGYPIPGTMQSISVEQPVPVDTVEIPAAGSVDGGWVRPPGYTGPIP